MISPLFYPCILLSIHNCADLHIPLTWPQLLQHFLHQHTDLPRSLLLVQRTEQRRAQRLMGKQEEILHILGISEDSWMEYMKQQEIARHSKTLDMLQSCQFPIYKYVSVCPFPWWFCIFRSAIVPSRGLRRIFQCLHGKDPHLLHLKPEHLYQSGHPWTWLDERNIHRHDPDSRPATIALSKQRHTNSWYRFVARAGLYETPSPRIVQIKL